LDIKGEYRISNNRQRVWEALNDPAVLRKCIPGCESLAMVGTTQMDARIVATIGPVKSKFDTRITLDNLNPPESYTLSGESKAGAAGFGRGSADVHLQEVDGGTLLTYSAKMQVGGKLAQVGSRLVLGATKKLADDFFGNFSRELDPVAVRGAPEIAIPVQSSSMMQRYWAIAGLATLALLIYWFLIR
jgi:carbon monoxide dehydrogenase subunit G